MSSFFTDRESDNASGYQDLDSIHSYQKDTKDDEDQPNKLFRYEETDDLIDENPEFSDGSEEFPEDTLKLFNDDFLLDNEAEHDWAEKLMDDPWENRHVYNEIMRKNEEQVNVELDKHEDEDDMQFFSSFPKGR